MPSLTTELMIFSRESPYGAFTILIACVRWLLDVKHSLHFSRSLVICSVDWAVESTKVTTNHVCLWVPGVACLCQLMVFPIPCYFFMIFGRFSLPGHRLEVINTVLLNPGQIQPALFSLCRVLFIYLSFICHFICLSHSLLIYSIKLLFWETLLLEKSSLRTVKYRLQNKIN